MVVADIDKKELAAIYGAHDTCPECILGLVIVVEGRGEDLLCSYGNLVLLSFVSLLLYIDAHWASNIKVVDLKGVTEKDQNYRNKNISIIVAR